MHKILLPSCRLRAPAAPAFSRVFVRFRTGGSPKRRPPPSKTGYNRKSPFDLFAEDSRPASRSVKQLLEDTPWAGTRITAEGLQPFLAEQAAEWAGWEQVHTRLEAYGIERNEVPPLLAAFTQALEKQPVFEDLHYTSDHIDRLVYDLSNDKGAGTLDSTLTRILYAWASNPKNRPLLSNVISPGTLARIANLFSAADLSNPAAAHDLVRAMPRRKFIMHVGPTNSGKTHNALRALAAAPRGIYAGPLRLLAHEIFERLNKGQIVPLGADPDADAEPDEDTGLDVLSEDGKPVVQKATTSKYARACNLMTGEEQRIVDANATLLSCTVEMVMSSSTWDVAVIDEIQMIADPERGGAWSNAIIGLNAKEIHLCGEEVAVPLIRKIVESMGDELVVHTYQRLTPLTVADESLGGDYSQVKKGDCVVCFARSSIFKARDLIQQKTGMKCALAYGRLPPELRTEQAALFNDPNSGYDVMVGSDAIGMGLNLKIKRIVFNAVQKWNGQELELLSLSQFKQISGRAGRFGLHGDDESGGVVTTLYKQDLPVLRKALEMPAEPLRYARIHPGAESLEAVAHALPAGTPLSTVQLVFEYVSQLPPTLALENMRVKLRALDYIDKVAGQLTLSDRFLLQLAPIAWRDPPHVEAVGHLMRMYQHTLLIDYRALLDMTGMQATLDSVKELMEKDEKYAPVGALESLESIHKFLILYLWLSYRLPVAFAERDDVTVVKDETEKMMQWCLQRRAALKPLNTKPAEGAEDTTSNPPWAWKQKRKFDEHPRSKDRSRPRPPAGQKDLRLSRSEEFPRDEGFPDGGNATRRKPWRRGGTQKVFE